MIILTLLGEFADVLRSKNAGPFEVTFDIMFEDANKYQHLKRTNVIKAETIAKLYKLNPDQVRIIYYDAAKGVKITIPRWSSSGSPEDTDIYGAQQHAPLLSIQVP